MAGSVRHRCEREREREGERRADRRGANLRNIDFLSLVYISVGRPLLVSPSRSLSLMSTANGQRFVIVFIRNSISFK